jgi:hypothetical protein
MRVWNYLQIVWNEGNDMVLSAERPEGISTNLFLQKSFYYLVIEFGRLEMP